MSAGPHLGGPLLPAGACIYVLGRGWGKWDGVDTISQVYVHPIETSYVISPYLPDGSVCWMFASRTISVGLFYNIGTYLDKRCKIWWKQTA